MTDPYRGTNLLGCPRCNEELHRGTVVECPRDCGIWDTATTIDGIGISELGFAVPQQVRPGPCPVCRRRMIQRNWNGIFIEVCGGHGSWVDRAYRIAFHARVEVERSRAVAIEKHEMEIAQLLAQLDNPEQRRDFARRFVELEARVATIERMMGKPR